jgi:hypothetical protein
VRNAAHDELGPQVGEAIHILHDQPGLAHQHRVLKNQSAILCSVQCLAKLRHKKRIRRRQSGNKFRSMVKLFSPVAGARSCRCLNVSLKNLFAFLDEPRD